MAFTTLAHHLDLEWLQEAYRRTRKDAAVGIDGQTGLEYAEHLEDNLRSLLERAKSGDHYKAPPVRRVYIPKREDDARRVMEVLPKRFGKYGLTLHPEKTRLINFKKPGSKSDHSDDDSGPGSFDLLGFTHYWATSRSGYPVIKLKTAKSRFSRALKKVAEWVRANRHAPVKEQHRMLCLKLKGHFEYYGITGNSAALGHFRHWVERIWMKWLSRRSQKARLSMTWTAMQKLLARYPLPKAIAPHSAWNHRAANP
jgi:hypothetical protein